MKTAIQNVNADPPVVPAAPPAAGPPADDPPSTLASILSFTQGLIPLLVAIVVLWYFGTAMKRMFGLTGPDVPEVVWGRNVYLYGGLEALAFAAAGFLFGREVNRQRAENAERNANAAQRTANTARDAAATSAANGRALAEGVRALDDTPREGVGAADALSLPTNPTTVRALRRMADAFFPAP